MGQYDKIVDEPRIFLTEGKSEKQIIEEIEALQGDSYVLVVQCDTKNPPLTYRRCKRPPSNGVSECDQSYYLGWNVWGMNFQKSTTYCGSCGWAYNYIRSAISVVVDTSKVSCDTTIDVMASCQRADIPCDICNWVDDEMEDWNTTDTLVTECDQCGEVRNCILSEDPYTRELYPEYENKAGYWCYQCYDTRAGDI
jgi:hypothetical protein